MAAPASIVTSHPPNGTPSLRDTFNALHDFSFGASTELVYSRDYLHLAARFDDQESEIEQVVFGDMQRCGCRCCGRHLPRLVRADEFDHGERFDAHALALARVEAAAAEVRAFNARVEAGRLAAIGGKQAKLFGLVGR